MDLTNFHLTFNDDFNTFDSSPDGSHGWKTQFYFDNGRALPSNGEQGFYSDSSVGVDPFHLDNGSLDIHAAPGSNPDGLPYNSGVITTEGDFTQTYGYFEIRAQLPEGDGMWPGFWLLKADKSWPPEIDALEAFGSTNDHGEGGADKVHVNAITHAAGGGGDWVNIPGNIYDGYHTYGVDWEPDTTTFYVDGQQVYSTSTPSDMHDPMYMLASLAVGGDWPGHADGNSGDMKIDYIRAYSQDPNVPAVASSDPSAAHSDATDASSADASAVPTDASAAGTSSIDPSAPDATSTDASAAVTSSIDPSAVHPATDGMAPADAPPASDAAPVAVTPPADTSDMTHAGANGSPTVDTSTPADPTALTLHVSADAWNGNPQFTVFVDGQQIGDVQTATANHGAGETQDITLHGDFSTASTVQINYVNDNWGGTPDTDRNLYVQSLDINGQHVAGNAANNNAAHGEASADPNAAVMHIDGTATFDVQHPTQDLWHV